MNYIPVQLDKARNLLMGFGALKTFKKTTGKSLAKIDIENDEFEELIPALFYSGLVWEDKELTLDKVTELIDKHLGIKKALEMVGPIFDEIFGKQDVTDVKNG